jgi:hypothetical protein
MASPAEAIETIQCRWRHMLETAALHILPITAVGVVSRNWFSTVDPNNGSAQRRWHNVLSHDPTSNAGKRLVWHESRKASCHP